jgi:hypothetical protein
MTTAFYRVPTSDWLTVSIPKDTARLVLADVRSLVSDVPGVAAWPDGGWRFGSGGLIRATSRGLVGVISCSGSALVELRAAAVFGAYLRAMSSESHRVTRLDAALDLAIPAPPFLNDLYARANRGEVRLSHKLAPAKRWVGLNAVGEETGTVYLGGHTAKVRLVAYDKRQERLDKGLPDPGPWLRVELRGSSDLGISLRDAWEPSPFFWHYCSGVLPCPSGVPAWVPGGVGFDLPPKPALDPADAFERRLSYSSELRDLVSQALSVEGGVFRLKRYLRQSGIDLGTAIG